MKTTTRQILICAMISFFLAVSSNQDAPSRVVDVAYKRPAKQSSTRNGKYQASNAVDGEEDCAQTRNEPDPWWRVDLGKSVWVESVEIASRTDLSDVDIRIGDKAGLDPSDNALCRQGLSVPKESTRYSCAEPMLGKYVYVIQKGEATLALCEVKVNVNGDAIDENVKYLVPTTSGKFLEKATYFKLAENNVFYFKLDRNRQPKISKKDIVIDLPPLKRSLESNADVLMPVESSGDKGANDKCGPKNHDIYAKGTFLNNEVKGKSLWLVQSSYTPLGEKEEKSKRFQCSLKDLRIKGDICQLENKCSSELGTHCDTKYISSSFPPGAYHCKCDINFVPYSKRLPGNVVLPGWRCIFKTKLPEIRHSKQNVAANMDTTASSTDNYAGCKKKDCKEVKAFGRYVVDGNNNTCFRSLADYKPWLMVELNDYHPISLVRIMTSKTISLHEVRISVGDKTQASRDSFKSCAFKDKIEKNRLLSFGCNELYVYGNAVKISSEAAHSILSLCEVEVYADVYANIALKQFSEGKSETSSRKANDGLFDTCFTATKKNPWWSLELGANVRVSMVFISTSNFAHLEGVDILVGESKEPVICTTIPKLSHGANYFECNKPVVGSFLNITLARGPRRQFVLCEVEVFQTKIVNLAAKRPTESNSLDSYKGCDQSIGEDFSTRQWWSVDLKAVCPVHMVRVVTDKNYKPNDLRNLAIEVGGSGEHDGFGVGTEVHQLVDPTEESVQIITLPKGIKARFVNLRLHRKYANLKFREVEIYNGPLVDVDECKKPNVCSYNYRCENNRGSYSCKCDGGYKETGTGDRKKCKDVDECANIESPCQAKESFCINTEGSFECKCNKGYEPVHDSKGHFQRCNDTDECKHPNKNRCPKKTSCVNLEGSYTCDCAIGYEQDKRSHAKGLKIKCQDIDECLRNSKVCHAKATCTNTEGSYKCACNPGLGGNGRTVCSPLKPCSDGKDCEEHQFCKDIQGTNLCDCEKGYHFVAKRCVDIDECELEKNICGLNSVCRNKQGSFACNCFEGFESKNEDGKNCFDTDECNKTKFRDCGEVAECKNTVGSFQCICPKGFGFDDAENKCYDIDECAVSGSCGLNMDCSNSAGSFSCSCKSGYREPKNQHGCIDIDECDEETYSCQKFSRCKNKNGSYDCPCRDGFETTVLGICSEICTPKCGQNSHCENGKCLCRRGFSMGLNYKCHSNEGLLGSGISLQSPAILLTAALLWHLILI